MKKKIIPLFLLVPLFVLSQNIFEKYEDNLDVSYISISPKMFQMLGKMSIHSDDPEAEHFFEMVRSIKTFKVLTTENSSIAKELETYALRTSKNQGMEELMRVRDGEANVKFYVKEKSGSDRIEELLMCVSDLNNNIKGRKFETVLLQLTGDIDLEQISKLTEQMDLPGGQQLKKAKQAKKKEL